MEPQLLTVAEGVHAWIGAGGDSNAGAVETPHGLLAIDAQQYPRLARAFRGAIEAKTGQPVRMLIDTHCHLDQEEFRDDLEATVRDIAAAASSLRRFAATIEQNPNALLTGRPSR